MNFVICGCGAIGSNLLVQLAKQFPNDKFYGIDYDVVEARNIKTQAYFREHVGSYKVVALRSILARFAEKIDYHPLQRKLELTPKMTSIRELLPGTKDDKIDSENYLIIDCFDNTASRKLLTKLDNCLHIGFSPQYTAEIIWDKDYDVPGDVDPAAADICSMDDAVSFIHFVVNFAVLNISKYIKEGKQENFIVTGKTKITQI
jgi:hypothetical protein